MIEQILAHSQSITHVITTYVVTPLLIIFAGLALAKILQNATKSFLSALQIDMRVPNAPVSLESSISNLIFVILALLSISFALASIHVFGFVIQRILFFLFWLGALAGMLALTDGIRNYFARKKATQQFKIGDTYSRNGLSGVVKKHTYTHLVIFTTQAERVHVPYLKAVQVKH